MAKLERAYTGTDYWLYLFGIQLKTFGKTWILDAILVALWLTLGVMWVDHWWMVGFCLVCACYRVYKAYLGYRDEWK